MQTKPGAMAPPSPATPVNSGGFQAETLPGALTESG
jgi:hypothetical protein